MSRLTISVCLCVLLFGYRTVIFKPECWLAVFLNLFHKDMNRKLWCVKHVLIVLLENKSCSCTSRVWRPAGQNQSARRAKLSNSDGWKECLWVNLLKVLNNLELDLELDSFLCRIMFLTTDAMSSQHLGCDAVSATVLGHRSSRSR